MFRNYKEFIDDYVDFYKISLFDADLMASEPSSNSSNAHCAAHWNSNRLFGRSEQSQISDSGKSLKTTFEGAIAPYKKAFEENLQKVNKYIDGCIQRDEGVSPAIGSTLIEQDGQQVTIGSFNKLDYLDFVYVLILVAGFVLGKRFLSSALRKSKYIENLGLRSKDRKRIDECIWRLIFYTFSSTWLVYSCFIKHNSLFFLSGNPNFQEYSFTVDLDEYIICLIETSFYFHSTYALIFEDVWRRDSLMMLLHHVAAIFSVTSVYATRLHRVGLATVVLRDTCDVLMEVTKLSMCLSVQNGKEIKSLKIWTKVSLWIFALSFAINQLYYYPLFCLYHGLNIIKVYRLRSPTIIGIFTCGLIFLLLDLAWFVLILRLVYRMMFSKEPMKDLREYDCDEYDTSRVDENKLNSSENNNGRQKKSD